MIKRSGEWDVPAEIKDNKWRTNYSILKFDPFITLLVRNILINCGYHEFGCFLLSMLEGIMTVSGFHLGSCHGISNPINYHFKIFFLGFFVTLYLWYENSRGRGGSIQVRLIKPQCIFPILNNHFVEIPMQNITWFPPFFNWDLSFYGVTSICSCLWNSDCFLSFLRVQEFDVSINLFFLSLTGVLEEMFCFGDEALALALAFFREPFDLQRFCAMIPNVTTDCCLVYISVYTILN